MCKLLIRSEESSQDLKTSERNFPVLCLFLKKQLVSLEGNAGLRVIGPPGRDVMGRAVLRAESVWSRWGGCAYVKLPVF